jgi:putative transposase
MFASKTKKTFLICSPAKPIKASWKGKVTFRWSDYAHGNKERKMTLSAEEFLRRFLLHVLPRGFVRIRHFGFLAAPRRRERMAVAKF